MVVVSVLVVALVVVLLTRTVPILVALSFLIWALVCCLWSVIAGLWLSGAASLVGAVSWFCGATVLAVVSVCNRLSRCNADGATPKVQCVVPWGACEMGAVLVGLCSGCNSFVMMDWHGCLGVMPFLIAVAIIW